MNHIVLWSGGPHSTYAIYSLLSRGNVVTAVHVAGLDEKEPQLPALRDSVGIELKVARITPPVSWTKIITMGLSAAHWIETRTTSIPKKIPAKDKISSIYLGKETEEVEVEKLIHAASPEYPIKQFKHYMTKDEIEEMMTPLGFPVSL